MYGYTLDKTNDESWDSYQIVMTSPNYYVAQTLNLYSIELGPKSSMVLTYEWDPKVVIYSLKIESLLIKASGNKYSQDKHYNISWNWDNVSLWWS